MAGLGNLYADEALFQCGICPQASRLDRERLISLFSAIQEVLRTSLACNADFEKLPPHPISCLFATPEETAPGTEQLCSGGRSQAEPATTARSTRKSDSLSAAELGRDLQKPRSC
ncbi:MAG: hypothetical protein MZV70_36420 [Desulfobacterales bacterium]|nr:hypothetical protein [Desulfobacterales bacterium]